MKAGQPGGWIRDVYDAFGLQRELEWLHKRINEVFTVGPIGLDRTLTPATETGNKTINTKAGTVRIAAAGTTVVVTNSLVDENSLIFCTIRTNDASAILKNVVPAAGLFTIHLTAAATAEVEIAFLVTN